MGLTHAIVTCCVLVLLKAQAPDDEWLDPTDMIQYDHTTQTQRRPVEVENVPTKRKQYTSHPDQTASCPDITECNSKRISLQRQVEELKIQIASVSKQTGCNPVFKRYLKRLLKDIKKLGLPDDQNPVHYDAEVVLSGVAVSEINKFLEGDDRLRPGALSEALGQILVNFKPHDYEAWKWRFEDTFGVEIETVLWICCCALILVVIICTEMWSIVSWFTQLRRFLAVCFFISFFWNWILLYKTAYADHQSKIVKMEQFNEKCTGLQRIQWTDSIKEWYRSTWTLQDDPCKIYYELLIVNPMLMVPPTKAISVTITTFITEPLKHFGQGISEFLKALLKDLPVTLQIPVLLTIVFCILVFMYGSAQAAMQHLVFRRRHDQPPPPLAQPRVPELGNTNQDPRGWGDADRAEVGRRQVSYSDSDVRRRHRTPERQRENQRAARVQNLGPGGSSGDETDAAPPQGVSEAQVRCCEDTAAAKTEPVKAEQTDSSGGDSQAQEQESSSIRVKQDTRKNKDPQKSEECSPTRQTQTSVPKSPAEVGQAFSSEDTIENIGSPTPETAPGLLN
ncbi:chloride channel CLIC-like protein 1 [Amia ocellicauda]|uniref:chloride channel CLIC-like protein 1 n=1 Tax=Amia ocellicauda TaxID=2972642 RepID=UPI003463BE84